MTRHIHHMDGNPKNNDPANLLIVEVDNNLQGPGYIPSDRASRRAGRTGYDIGYRDGYNDAIKLFDAILKGLPLP